MAITAAAANPYDVRRNHRRLYRGRTIRDAESASVSTTLTERCTFCVDAARAEVRNAEVRASSDDGSWKRLSIELRAKVRDRA